MQHQKVPFPGRGAAEYSITHGACRFVSSMHLRIMPRGLLRRREILFAAWVLALVWCIYAMAFVSSCRCLM